MPFGESFVDEHSSTWESPYKFSGKEIDTETGLYYYGARYYDPKTSIWYGVDPLAGMYPNVGGYVYCLQNPVILTDKTGLSPYYDIDGNYLGNDEKGFKGNIYITTKDDFDANSKDGTANSKTLQENINTTEFYKKRQKMNNESIDKVFNHIANGTIAPDGTKLGSNKIKLIYDKNLSQRIGIDANAYADGKINGVYIMSHAIGDYEWTIENIRATIIHEIWGHEIKGWSGGFVRGNTHYKCYQAEIDSKYWDSSTERYKKHTVNNYYKYFYYSGKDWNQMPLKYQSIVQKYYSK
jgi:RHS repeat-associated protein